MTLKHLLYYFNGRIVFSVTFPQNLIVLLHKMQLTLDFTLSSSCRHGQALDLSRFSACSLVPNCRRVWYEMDESLSSSPTLFSSSSDSVPLAFFFRFWDLEIYIFASSGSQHCMLYTSWLSVVRHFFLSSSCRGLNTNAEIPHSQPVNTCLWPLDVWI